MKTKIRKIFKGKIFHYLAISVFLIAGLIMLRNTFAFPPENSYDYGLHLKSLNYLIEPEHEFPVIPKDHKYAYSPALYYYLFAKVHMVLQWATNTHYNPYYTFRIFHLGIYLGIFFLFVFRLIPKYIKDDRYKLVGALIFASVPNFYLTQQMVRADHLTFLSLGLLFFLWYYYDFDKKFSTSWWRILSWSFLLILLGNTRHFAAVGYLWFFFMGLWLLGKEYLAQYRQSFPKIILLSIVVIFTLLGSGYYYLYQIYRGSSPIGWTETDSYSIKYKHYEKYRGLDVKLPMLTNMDFVGLLETPNRSHPFGENVGDFENIDKDYFENKILGSLSDENDKRILEYYEYIEDKSKYTRLNDLSEEEKIDSQALIYGAVSHDNAYFPRVYGDMWADHWLFFSGPVGKDYEIREKQIVLVAAIPFTLVYFFSAAYFAFEGFLKFIRKKNFEYYHVAGFLFSVLFILMTIYTNFFFAEPGKNSIVKFAYMVGYSYLPFLTMVAFVERYLRGKNERLLHLVLAYLSVLFILILPLAIY